MIRPAAPRDIPAVVEYAIKMMNIDPYPELVISKEKILFYVRECVSSAHNFAWVAEQDGKLVGAIAVLVTPNHFYERSCASVLMWHSEAPGEGIKLFREFLKWARSRPIIKIIEYTMERGADPRIGKMLERLGLKLSLPVYLEVI